jgi:hypothetical protein
MAGLDQRMGHLPSDKARRSGEQDPLFHVILCMGESPTRLATGKPPWNIRVENARLKRMA